MLKSRCAWLLVFVVACVITGFLFVRLPGGFLPTEDQGHIFITYTGAPGSTEERTQQAVNQVEAFLRTQPQVRNVASVMGFSFFGQGQSAALSFVDLKPWGERPAKKTPRAHWFAAPMPRFARFLKRLSSRSTRLRSRLSELRPASR